MISIITPIYNTENYVKRCLDSILSQNLLTYEVIMINDGSTDGSRKICEQYAQKYNNFILIDQVNSGPSRARNQGINTASGKYIMFIDSDDYFLPEKLKEIEEIIMREDEIDTFFFKILTKSEVTKIEKPKLNYKNIEKVDNRTGEWALGYFIDTEQIITSNYAGVFKKSMIDNFNISFNEDQRIGEDIDFMLKIYLNSHSVKYINEFVITYIKDREGQITGNVNNKKIISLQKHYFNIYEDILNDKNCVNKKLAYKYLSRMYISSLRHVDNKDIDQVNSYQKNAVLLRYAPCKFKILYFIYVIFGFNSAVKLFKKLRK